MLHSTLHRLIKNHPVRFEVLRCGVAEQRVFRETTQHVTELYLRLVPLENKGSTGAQNSPAFRKPRGQIFLPGVFIQSSIFFRHPCGLTINPVVGCSKCSPGCENCYAEKMAYRLSKMQATAQKYAGVVDKNGWTGKISRLDLSCFDKLPKKSQRVFVGSMTDMFHPNLDDDGQGWRALLNSLWDYPQHIFMFLTKRAERMRTSIEWLIAQDGDLPDNLWLGVTVCNQQEADEKIPVLLEIPTAKRFVNIEPMLGPIDLRFHIYSGETGEFRTHNGKRQLKLSKPADGGLHWVITGPETGPKARPAQEDWFRILRDQCQEASVPFFLKKNVDGSRLLDGREWNEVPS